ncbi:MAG: SGNH/GDSL hydrolase family protein [Clostridia bacterium]|nr:SGNH/GDSL hydrolase family protein [Clostridia bacterium]
MRKEEKEIVVLLGDSIRLGYCERVKERLSGAYTVWYPSENCRHTQYMITALRGYAETLSNPEQVCLVVFNCGHWDAAHFGGALASLTSEAEYRRNLQMLLSLLRRYFPRAHLVFATTTPMNPASPDTENPRTDREIVRYNAAAREVMADEGVTVFDLFAHTRSWGEAAYIDYCHFSEEAFAALGEYVAEEIQKLLS